MARLTRGSVLLALLIVGLTALVTLALIGAASAQSPRVVVGPRAASGDRQYAVVVNNVRNVSALDLTITFPPDVSPGLASAAGIAKSCAVAFKGDAGRVTIALACPLPLYGSGTVALFGTTKAVRLRDFVIEACALDERPCATAP